MNNAKVFGFTLIGESTEDTKCQWGGISYSDEDEIWHATLGPPGHEKYEAISTRSREIAILRALSMALGVVGPDFPVGLEPKAWCSTHLREAEHVDEKSRFYCDPKLGGIAVSCQIKMVDATELGHIRLEALLRKNHDKFVHTAPGR